MKLPVATGEKLYRCTAIWGALEPVKTVVMGDDPDSAMMDTSFAVRLFDETHSPLKVLCSQKAGMPS